MKLSGYSGKSFTEKIGIKDNVLVFFTADKNDLAIKFEKLAGVIKKDSMIWICWPKKASQIKTNLDENIIRAIGIQNKMVDVKVIAVDENWSGLKFVYRLKDR